ncbi:MAG TPA: threo-3-hydroxy-L-aspartate ammonia-lyase [Burkholderiales bacterium]
MAGVLTYDEVEAAARRLAGVVRRTPVLASASVDAAVGARVYFKCENLQRAGAFKIRGAYNALACLPQAQKRRGVATFSSGNHGQALALAAGLHGTAAVIVMPSDAPATKVAATRAYGGEVVFYDRRTQDREALARALAEERGLALVPPFDDPRIIAGQGTAAKELFEDAGALDYLLVPLGGGGLLAGAALAAARLAPGCRVIGVEPARGNDGQLSLRAGRIVAIDVPDTIADGARTTHLGVHTFAVIRAHVADIVTVDDAALRRTMRYLFERMKLVVEPTGALAAAALLEGAVPVRGARAGVILSGGNVDVETYARLVGG